MTEEKEKIIERVRKCLELSKCADEGEAAAAVLAARRLMDKYGITEQALEIASIGESRAKSGAKQYPAQWESNLAYIVGRAFGCRSLFATNPLKGSFFRRGGDRIFIGQKTATEIAAYTFTVLLRKVKSARRECLRRWRRFGREMQIRRGDLFCYAWVESVEKKVAVFAAQSNSSATIDAYIEQKYNLSPPPTPRNRTGGDLDFGDIQAFRDGISAGADVTLQHGVKGGREQGLLV